LKSSNLHPGLEKTEGKIRKRNRRAKTKTLKSYLRKTSVIIIITGQRK
jgi:3'-phosphoadenosine 5'-phosphosulfate sulfotransferase (PAPS reductase)/FAD synthetase